MTFPVTHPLHLYRALLRQTTYLFDHNARQWTYGYIKSSFRTHAAKVQHGKQWHTIPYDPNRAPTSTERRLLKRGRKFLALLQRANQGHQRPLKNVLQLAYGRKGRKKRVLMVPLMQPGLHAVAIPATISNDAEALRKTVAGPSKTSSGVRRASAAFMSMLHAQNHLSGYLTVRRQIRFGPLEIKTNRWGRPMPPARIKNKTRKWYARMAAALMPPLPENEWNYLKAIAMQKQELPLRPKRSRATTTVENGQIEEAQEVANTFVLGISKIADQKTVESVRSPHKMTPRFLSRFYARHVFNHTPMAVPHPEGKGLLSKWDDGKRDVFQTAKPKNDRHADTLFG